MENNEMYNYLMEKFGNCEVLPSGDFKAKDQNANYYYVSSDCTPGADVHVYADYPGLGDGGDTYGCTELYDQMDIPSGVIQVLSNSHSDRSNLLDRAYGIVEEQDLTITRLGVRGFSGSGGSAMTSTNDLLEKHPELTERTFILSCDGDDLKRTFNYEKCKTLIDGKVPIFMLVSDSTAYDNENKEIASGKYVNMGYNSFYIDTEEKIGHEGLRDAAIENQLLWYFGGDVAKIGDGITLIPFKCTADGLISIDVDALRFSNYLHYNIDLNKIFFNGPIIIGEYSSDASSKYSYLKSLDTYNVYSLSSKSISSELQYVTSFSNSILNSIKSDSVLSSTTLIIPQGCGPLAGVINNCLNSYYNSVGVLLEKISQETKAVMSFGRVWDDVDVSLDHEIKENVTPLSSPQIDTISPDGSSVEPPNNEMGSGIDTDLKSDIDIDNSSDLVMTEDGPKKTSTIHTNPKKNPGNGGVVSKPHSNSVLDAKLVSDTVKGNKREIIYDKGDYNVLFETVNNDVVSMKYQFVYDSSEIASSNYDLFLKLKGNENIESIILNGDMIEIIFKDNLFKNIDINKLLEHNFMNYEL